MVLEPSMIRQIYREEFEQSGVDDVRKHATARIYSGDKLLEALKWLNKKEHGGLAKEQSAIARDAVDAAWVSARAPESNSMKPMPSLANKRATIGIGAVDLDHCCKRDADKKTTTIDRWARTPMKLATQFGG
jgi:hypothetical protein